MRPRLIAGLIAVATMLSIAVPTALAHYRVDWQNWYFGGFTHKSTAGTKASRSDPVNVIFFGSGQASLSAVRDHLFNDWDHHWYRPDKAMNDWGCLVTYSYFIAHPQYMVFKGLNDVAAGQPSVWWDEFDTTTGTNSNCTTQYHMRLWDDYEHDQQTVNHTRNTWVVGNIHHDKFVGGTKWHALDQSWEQPAFTLVSKLAEHCSYYKWRRLAGTKGVFQDHWSDGYVTIILMKHVSDPGPCPRRP